MRKMMAIGGAVCAAALTLSSGAAMATQPEDGAQFSFPGAPTAELSQYILVDGHKVTFCHRTGSAKNPYVIITSDIASVDDTGDMTTDHQQHQQVGNGLGPDIIPISFEVKKNIDLVPLALCLEQPPYPSS